MKHKNFVKIILIAVSFAGMFFAADRAEAIQCCSLLQGNPGEIYKQVSCRLKGSTPCDTADKNLCDLFSAKDTVLSALFPLYGVYSSISSVGSCAANLVGKGIWVKQKEVDCLGDNGMCVEMFEPSKCCLIRQSGGSTSMTEEQLKATSPTDCRLETTEKPCDTRFLVTRPANIYSQEEKANCAIYPICKNIVTEKLNDCTLLKIPKDCDLFPALCFWSANRQACFSRSDTSFCSGFNKADCAETKGACTWSGSDEDGQCLSPLLKGVSDKYGTEDRGFLPGCSFTGSCKSLENILYPVKKIANEIFKYIGALAFIFFVYGGFTMILSFGNAEKFKKGQQILVAAVIGLVIVFGAYLMVSFLLEALGVGAEFTAIK